MLGGSPGSIGLCRYSSFRWWGVARLWEWYREMDGGDGSLFGAGLRRSGAGDEGAKQQRA